MRRHILQGSIGLGLGAGLLVAPMLSSGVSAQEVRIVDSAITLSGGGRAELWFELSDESEHHLRFDDGSIELDGSTIGSYRERGDLADAWREFLREHAGSEDSAVRAGLLEFRSMLAEWEADGSSVDPATLRAFGQRLDEVFDLVSETVIEAPAIAELGGEARRLQIAPWGGADFDVSKRLEQLKELLRRLGDLSETFDEELAMIVHDDFVLSTGSEIEGHLALLDGRLRLEGEVEGDVLILDGTLELAEGARIEGNVLQVGGDLEISGDGVVIEGEILSDVALAPETPVTEAEAPVVVEVSPERSQSNARGRGRVNRVTRNFARAAEGVGSALSTFVCLAVLGVLLVYFAQGRLETVSDTVRHEFARSFAMGLAGQVLFFPALLVLVVLVITWPIVPFFVLAAGLAGLLGYVAVAHGAGEMFAQRRYRYEWLERLRRSNSYYYVVSGLLLMLLPFAVGSVLWVLGGAVDAVRGLILFVAALATWILVTAGFGSVLLTRAGGRSVVVDWASGAEPAADTADSSETPGEESDDALADAADAEFTVDEPDDA